LACLIAFALISTGAIGLPARAQRAPDDPGFEFQWGFTQIGVQEAWETGQGRGASVAVLDTGVDLTHEDLAGRLLSGGRDTHGDEASPQDDRGEGTHVAGIIAASTNNGTGVAGIAYEAKVLPIKVLDSRGDGFEADVIEGIRLAIQKKVQVMVVNLDESIILADGGFAFKRAIRDAWSAGVVPVVSADHEFVRSSLFSDAPALVVSAVSRDGKTPPDSNGVGAARWGLAAPGGAGTGDENDIFSTYLAGTRRDGLGGTREYADYLYDSGDIQAAAHVAGAAAILRGLGQTPQQTVDRLLSNANDAGSTGRDRIYGNGILHAGKSVRGLPPAQSEASGAGTGSATTAPGGQSGSGGAATPANGGTVAQPERVGPQGPASAPPPVPGIGAPAGADTPGEAPAPDGEAISPPGDVVGGLATGASPEAMPGRTPLLPLVAFILLVGSATIAWTLRRRTLERPPPINASL